MENLGLVQFNNKYKNLKVLVTGHTGFKGSWLLLWLDELGAKTYCISDKYLVRPNHLKLLKLKLYIYTHFINLSRSICFPSIIIGYI